MREIKFRAWHKLTKQMAVVDMLDFVLDAYRAHAGTSSGSGHLHHIELMQYTGLNDRSGKEIYEGDIVRVEGRSVEIIDYGVACFRSVSRDGFKMALEDIAHLQIEVIGNIYEQVL